jgi:hypothetical protein
VLGRNIVAIDLFYLFSGGRRSSAASSKVAFPDLKKHVEKESLWKHKVVCNVKHRHENSRAENDLTILSDFRLKLDYPE